MDPSSRKVASLLTCIQDATRRRGTNAYQIAKATGLPLRSVQKLLAQATNPTLVNVHRILDGFGLSLHVQDHGGGTIRPGRQAKRLPSQE